MTTTLRLLRLSNVFISSRILSYRRNFIADDQNICVYGSAPWPFLQKIDVETSPEVEQPQSTWLGGFFSFSHQSDLPRKQITKTSRDLGVNFPQVLSPARPVTTVDWPISQPYLKSTTSRVDLIPYSPNRPLTPIQHYINSSRNFRNKKPKIIRCETYRDRESMLRTHTRQGSKI